MDLANKDSSLNLYGPSGWLTDRCHVRKGKVWSVITTAEYQKDSEAWDEWGGPVYDKDFLNQKIASKSATKATADEACATAKQLFDEGKLTGER